MQYFLVGIWGRVYNVAKDVQIKEFNFELHMESIPRGCKLYSNTETIPGGCKLYSQIESISGGCWLYSQMETIPGGCRLYSHMETHIVVGGNSFYLLDFELQSK